MTFVLDTDTLIYFFKEQGNVAKRLLATRPRKVFVPTVVLYELQVGIEKSTSPTKRTEQLRQLLMSINLAPFGHREAMVSAQARAIMEKAGDGIGPHDYQIAGTALARGSTLVTRNTKEFSKVPGLEIENWF